MSLKERSQVALTALKATSKRSRRLDLASHQAKHLIDNAALLERHIEEKDRDMAELLRVGEALTNDLRTKIDEKSEITRRLEERLNDSARELRSCQNDLLIANQRVENLVKAQQYQEEQHCEHCEP